MPTSPTDQQIQWTLAWLDTVIDGGNKMSSRNIRSIARRGGGLKAVVKLAKQRHVHLLLLEDDKGQQLVAASAKPFKVLS